MALVVCWVRPRLSLMGYVWRTPSSSRSDTADAVRTKPRTRHRSVRTNQGSPLIWMTRTGWSA